MKNFLLCMMLAGLMMPVVAQGEFYAKTNNLQEKKAADLGIFDNGMLPINPKGSLVNVDGWKIVGISESYDRQTQGSVYPMAMVHSDGFIGVTWTNDDNDAFDEGSTIPNRGIGYSYSTDGGATWSWDNADNPEYQQNRAGGIPLYWPSYAQWGNGEAILGRSMDSYDYNGIAIKDGLVLLTRPNKGQGEWTITPVPYPEGYDPGVDGFMAWARMSTSGPNREYIHIISPLRTPNAEPYRHPTFYYRTQDGVTWNIEARPVPEMVGQEWHDYYSYTDGIDFAVQGNTVACSFISMGNHGFVIRSLDNGDNWECIKFFDSPIRYELTPADYADSVYVPAQGTIALDNDGKIHVAFSLICAANSDGAGTLGSYWPWAWAQYLSYWNEDMPMLDGAADFTRSVMMPQVWDEYFDLDQSTDNERYVISTVPKWPIIGYFTPLVNEHLYKFSTVAEEWAGKSYMQAGMFSFPQMVFDSENKLHLFYLGLLDNGEKANHWLRHPFYTTTADKGQTWTQTEYLVNNINLIDREFAYLTLAGVTNQRINLISQEDVHAGTYLLNPDSDHGITANHGYFFHVECPDCKVSIDDIEYSPLSMSVYPNPASKEAIVKFEGKGNITVYNMLGQVVYHVENVVGQQTIPLNDVSGIYFVTLRSGNATATQKLIVK